jgi:hypothetical protein
MPRANPESAFEVAVRHLFRHVRDADALRRNPIVHTFFANTLEVPDGAVLREIHDRILGESATLCDKPKEPALQARRRHAIIVALCAGESDRVTFALALRSGGIGRCKALYAAFAASC